MEEQKRKGARSIKEIPKDILEKLNKGELESANLVEFIGIDAKILLETVLTQHGRIKYLMPILEQVDKLTKRTIITINNTIASGLFEQTLIHNDKEFISIISKHKSDLVRSWATELIGKNTKLNIEQTLSAIRIYAMDSHFNVRECAWSAVRNNIINNLNESLIILAEWAKSDDENIRRFASEATRPRGVWCEHIKELKENPQLGLPIIEPLMLDKSRYVQNSVANWLNDASKSKPEFVINFCESWKRKSGTKETEYIIKRALRTLNKAN